MKYILSILFLVVNSFAYDAFITVDTLKENLENKKLVILDVNSKSDYDKSHIIGALHVELSEFINTKDALKPLPLAKNVEKQLQKLGINNDSQIVIYSRSSEQEQLSSSYLAFVLILHGFNNVSILDGGYMSWVFKHNRLVSSETSKMVKKSNYDPFVSIEDKSLIVTKEYIQSNLENIKILDSRSTSHYFGTTKSLDIKKFGHIPNAKSSYYKDKFLSDLTLRSTEELDDIFILGLSLHRENDVIIYGDSIFSASMNWFILYQQLGFKNTKIYEASFLEWGNVDLSTTMFKWE